MRIRTAVPAVLAGLLVAVPAAHGRASGDVAALQVALRAVGAYDGTVDGLGGPATRRAVARFQARRGLHADGVAGPATRRALGRRGRPAWGSRALRRGARGWDVAVLQFLLARRGFPSGELDGGFGARTTAALRRYQRWTGLRPDGVVGGRTRRSLRRAPPVAPFAVFRPVPARVADRFGPRGARFHSGVDFPVRSGVPVLAAHRGSVAFAGWHAGGYGKLVVIAHPSGLSSWYAHLSRIDVRRGAGVAPRQRVGRTGATGRVSGPHLHFELRRRGAVLDPLPAMRL